MDECRKPYHDIQADMVEEIIHDAEKEISGSR